ncbi:peroxiredoxin, partial [Bacteroides uniformis]
MLYFCKQKKRRSVAPQHHQANWLLHSVCTIFALVKQKTKPIK